ncbi:MAG: GNAT family N-acetyltransferase [Pseudomonadota bacterium]
MADIATTAEGGGADWINATFGTGRLLLRPLRASDAGPMELYAGDARVARMTTSIPHPYPPGAAAAYIERQGRPGAAERVWVIDGTPIGAAEMIGIVSIRRASSEIGYWVGPPFWNTGYASEAVEAVLATLFAEDVPEVRATVFADNPASAHVLEKLGFVEIGLIETFSVARGEAAPTRVFRLAKAAFQAASDEAGGR